jgi:ParB-like chromosome segregation protein Spo0J
MRLKINKIKTGTNPAQWAIFRRQELIHEHLDQHGMKNPIVVNSKYELQFGGCRLQYAVLKGLEEIEAIVTDDIDEVRRLQNQQSLFEYTFLPEEYIERKQGA